MSWAKKSDQVKPMGSAVASGTTSEPGSTSTPCTRCIPISDASTDGSPKYSHRWSGIFMRWKASD
eukprot:2101716-Pyramimonas_sp.AAC.1